MRRIRKHATRARAMLGIALGLFAAPLRAEHMLQSIALNSSDTGFVTASSFVRDDDRLYLAGGFFGDVDFNPNGSESLWTSTCPSTYGCSFVAAYDADMQIEWFDLFYGTGDSLDQTLVARSGGGVYLLLDFSDELAYVPNATEPRYRASGASDIAAIALDADGDAAGSVQFGMSGTNALRKAHAFESSAGAVDLVWMHLDDADALGTDSIVARANVATGTLAAPLIAIEAADDGTSIAIVADQRVDAAGRYVCGSFRGTVDFDALHAHRVVETAPSNAFIARYDANGALAWLSTLSGESGSSCDGVAVAPDGTLWATGAFGGAEIVQSDGGSALAELTAWGFDDTYLLAYDALGALRTSGNLGGPQTQVFPDRIEAFDDGTLAITGTFIGTITNGFTGLLARASASDYGDAFVLVVGSDLGTRYFGQVEFDEGYTFETPVHAIAPMQIEAITQMAMLLGGNADLNYALPPEHALLHNDGTWASAYVRYDLDALFGDGFDAESR
jgi:hypothetical protein